MSSTPDAGGHQTTGFQHNTTESVEPPEKDPAHPTGAEPAATRSTGLEPTSAADIAQETGRPRGIPVVEERNPEQVPGPAARHNKQPEESDGPNTTPQQAKEETLQPGTNDGLPEATRKIYLSVPGKTEGTSTPDTQYRLSSTTLGLEGSILDKGEEQFTNLREKPLAHFYCTDFLPAIYTEDQVPDQPPPTLSGDSALCEELARKLGVDDYFFTKSAWDSNGFFMSQQATNESPGSICRQNDASRFLIKLLQDPQEQPRDYTWLYLSFCSVWIKAGAGDKVSCILLCFDDSEKIKDHITSAFMRCSFSQIKAHPLAIHDVLLRVLIKQYDEALWLFRVPIRRIEKGRQDFARRIRTVSDHDPTNSPAVMEDYVSMHELSRHIIHMSETLQVAAKTVKAVVGISQLGAPTSFSGACPYNVVDGLRFSSGFLANLKLRADAFAARLSNEIQLAYDIVSVHQLTNTERLLEESKDEGKDLTYSVTVLTLFFLPSTFVAGFWGMNFFTLSDDLEILLSPHTWVFFAMAIPSTAIAFTIWGFIHYWGWSPSLRPFNLFRRREPRRKVKRQSEA